MSVFTVFKGPGKGIRNPFKSNAPQRRAQSPPSPGSFSTPETEKHSKFYPLFEASKSSLNQTIRSQTSTQLESSKRSSGPKVEIDFGLSGSLSDWFPPDLIRSNSPAPSHRPQRNESLGVIAGSGGSGGVGGNVVAGKNSESSLRTLEPTANGRLRADSHSNTAARHFARPRAEDAVTPVGSRGQSRSYEEDEDVILIIEPPRGRDVSLSATACIDP